MRQRCSQLAARLLSYGLGEYSRDNQGTSAVAHLDQAVMLKSPVRERDSIEVDSQVSRNLPDARQEGPLRQFSGCYQAINLIYNLLVDRPAVLFVDGNVHIVK